MLTMLLLGVVYSSSRISGLGCYHSVATLVMSMLLRAGWLSRKNIWLRLSISAGRPYLGAAICSQDCIRDYTQDHVSLWAHGLSQLSLIAATQLLSLFQLFCTLLWYACYQGYLLKRKSDLANQVGYSLMGSVACKLYKAVNNCTRNEILCVSLSTVVLNSIIKYGST